MVDVWTDVDVHTEHTVFETFLSGRMDGCRSTYRTQSRRHLMVDIWTDVDQHTGHTTLKTFDGAHMDGHRSTYRT